MTIAGRMLALIIEPHAINNLLIPSLTLFIFFFSSLSSLPPVFSPLSPLIQPSSSPYCSLSLPSLPPSLLSHSIFSPRSPLPRCPLILAQVSRSQRAIPPFSTSITCFSLQTCSPHFHTFTHSPLILATLPSSSSSSSSSSFSPALLSSEF